MSTPNDRLMDCVLPSNIIYMKFVQSHSDSEYDYFCCVEGIADEAFYRAINMPLFSEKAVRFLYADYDANNKNNHDVGKEAVIVSCEEIYKHHPKEFMKCTFIVDHDYFGLDDCKHTINPKVEKFISVLPVYSFENFFMQEENLQRILKFYLNDNDINKFELIYEKFLVEIREYFALKRTVSANYNKMINVCVHLEYKNYFEDSDIFFFNFKKVPFFRVDIFNDELKSMYEFVASQPSLYRYFVKSKEILSSSTDLLKGKILYRFLIYFLKQVHGVFIEMYSGKEYEERVNRLQINVDIIVPTAQLHMGRH